jgi:FMN-dependent NADH-azoreductase
MPRLLVVEVSPQLANSVSRRLTARFVDAWREANADGDIITRDLATAGIPFISEAWIHGAFAPPEMHTDEASAAMKYSDELIAEVQSADHILIGTPMHNLTVPATLKAYIDQVVRVGATVSPANEGLVTGKRAAIILASGGDFSAGAPAEHFDHATPYLRAVLGFIGITDLQILKVGPTRTIMTGERDAEEHASSFAAAIDDVVTSWS